MSGPRERASDPYVWAQVVARAARGDWEELRSQIESAGGCANPVRLRGSLHAVDPETGEAARLYSTEEAPDGVLLKACGHRRATRCRSCSETYRGDARAIVRAGLMGGKNVAEDVSDRPAAFLTLTAPSFGPVHVARAGACHPGARRCRHQRSLRCDVVHKESDDAVGQALCPDCYDYAGAVVWNASVTELWKRTALGARRALARHARVTVKQLESELRLSYVKVVEFQRRGVVHLHCLVRADPTGVTNVDAEALCAALQLGALRARAQNPLDPDTPVTWGEQIEVRPVQAKLRPAVVSYLAKYATKSTDDDGALDRPVTRTSLALLDLSDHLRRMVTAALDLDADPRLAGLNLARWAHTLGYRGHWVTKSHRWSTTFGALREERHAYRRQEAGVLVEPGRIEVGSWEYAGRGYTTAGDLLIAESVSAGRRVARQARWDL